MVEQKGTRVQFFPAVGDSVYILATVEFATGHRNDPEAEDPSTTVIAELRVDELPASCMDFSVRCGDQWVIRGVPRAESLDAARKLGQDFNERGWWKPALVEVSASQNRDARGGHTS
jgi:hypothetical protein